MQENESFCAVKKEARPIHFEVCKNGWTVSHPASERFRKLGQL